MKEPNTVKHSNTTRTCIIKLFLPRDVNGSTVYAAVACLSICMSGVDVLLQNFNMLLGLIKLAFHDADTDTDTDTDSPNTAIQSYVRHTLFPREA